MATAKAKTSKLAASGARAKSAAIEDLPAAPRIVFSAHLVSPKSAELSEFEYGMILAWNAFSRWVVRCLAAAGIKDMTTMEVLLLHHVHHRARKKKLADICFMYNIEDTHVVSYSLKKLIAAGLVKTEKSGKEVLYSTTPKGGEVIERYRSVRELCLIPGVVQREHANETLADLAQFLRFLAAHYDQASRAATAI